MKITPDLLDALIQSDRQLRKQHQALVRYLDKRSAHGYRPESESPESPESRTEPDSTEHPVTEP